MSRFMACPKCGEHQSKTTETREHYKYNWIVRRRTCLECGAKWKTYEIIEGEIIEDNNE